MVRDGYKFVVPPLALGVVAGVFGWRVSCVLLVLLAAAVAYFFRDPKRMPPADPNAVVAPGDGRVMEVIDEPFDGRPGWRISIFLAVWNVHVSRSPMAGRFERVEYVPGRFFVAARARASAENEQNIIHLQTAHGKMVFKQIAGFIARRVVCWKAPGDQVTTGERIGLIRFGSRMDVWLPREAQVIVKPGEHVAGGVSILAQWR